MFAHLSDTTAHVDAEVREAIRGCDVLAVNTPFLHAEPSAGAVEILGEAFARYAHDAHISIPAAIRLARDVSTKHLVLLHISHTTPERDLQRVAAENPGVLVPDDGEMLDL